MSLLLCFIRNCTRGDSMLSAIISFLALILSGYSFYKQREREKIVQNTIFFEKIFFKFLTQDCVEARNDIRFNSDGKLENTERFENLVADLGKKIEFYEYVDKNFYESLKGKLNQLDELLVGDHLKGKKQTEHFVKIDEKVEEIFNLIMNKYFVH